ncbi:GNAT family N-acetyltransferase [Virgibacillus byunsanensis]|uniref:GNAT family N-acetyltransferase n=1 Tax=Virgibacillus byunsanensis TaxID=570945 RepID=A0ABW3LKR5_9BACI
MISIKRLSECSLDDALAAWNLGFEDYFVDISFTLDVFLGRMAMEDLSPNLSIVAFDGEKPIGIVKSGIREINGNKFAWNGGTAVAKDYRKRGVAKRLMHYLLAMYTEENVTSASLEAIKENKMAIALYKGFGYVEKDELANFSLKGSKPVRLSYALHEDVSIIETLPQKVGEISFYKSSYSWQTQWQSVQNGEAIIAIDSSQREIGYAYFKRIFNKKFQHTTTVLYQCEADPSHSNREEVTKFLLTKVFGDFSDDINRIVVNLPRKAGATTYKLIQEIGFEITVKQVFMKKEWS